MSDCYNILDSREFPNMTVQLIKETLSDGSPVWDVRFWLGSGCATMFAYEDEKVATEAYTAIVNALDKAL